METDAGSILMLSGLALYAAIFFLPFWQEDVAVPREKWRKIESSSGFSDLFVSRWLVR